MIPITDTDISVLDFEATEMPSFSYNLDRSSGRIRGFTDELEAIKQAIYLIVNTERYQYPIYSWNYGTELGDLIGQPIPYVLPEIKRRVTEALLQDERITAVDNWIFDVQRGKVTVYFTAHTIFGGIEADTEVNI